MMEIPIYIILGLFVGVLGGLFGIGGGVIIVPALLFVLTYLGYESDLLIHICVATSLGTIFFTAFASAFEDLVAFVAPFVVLVQFYL